MNVLKYKTEEDKESTDVRASVRVYSELNANNDNVSILMFNVFIMLTS